MTAAEVYEGAHGQPQPESHLKRYRALLRPFRKLGLNERIILRFARLRADLRQRGQLISDFDILLAATALEYGLTVLTRNTRHFNRIPGLQLYTAP